MSKYPETIQKLIAIFKKFPGVGQKTGERFAFTMISWTPEEVDLAVKTFLSMQENLCQCDECGALYEKNDQSSCRFCTNPSRQQNTLCLIASSKDIFTIEQTGIYNGLYHVIDGLLSPIDGYGPENIGFDKLKMRLNKRKVQEVILAFDATIEGDATALYLKRELQTFGISVSRLALGMPLGSSLEYLDEGTLAQAMLARLPV